MQLLQQNTQNLQGIILIIILYCEKQELKCVSGTASWKNYIIYNYTALMTFLVKQHKFLEMDNPILQMKMFAITTVIIQHELEQQTSQ